MFALKAAEDQGHCYVKRTQLVAATARVLGVQPTKLGRAVDELLAEGRLEEDDGERVAPAELARAERLVVSGVARLLPAAAERADAG